MIAYYITGFRRGSYAGTNKAEQKYRDRVLNRLDFRGWRLWVTES